MQLNFNKVQKRYLTVTLIDGRVLIIGTPTKKLLDKLLAMNGKVNGEVADNLTQEDVDSLYKLTGEVMSVNKTNTIITSKEVNDLFDLEDLMLFFNAYMSFLDSIVSSKN